MLGHTPSLRAIISQETELQLFISKPSAHPDLPPCLGFGVHGGKSLVSDQRHVPVMHIVVSRRGLCRPCALPVMTTCKVGWPYLHEVLQKRCVLFCRLQGRCAAVLFYGHQLAVLPAVGSDAPDLGDDDLCSGGGTGGGGDGNGGAGAGVAAAVANSYVVDLSAQGIREV